MSAERKISSPLLLQMVCFTAHFPSGWITHSRKLGNHISGTSQVRSTLCIISIKFPQPLHIVYSTFEKKGTQIGNTFSGVSIIYYDGIVLSEVFLTWISYRRVNVVYHEGGSECHSGKRTVLDIWRELYKPGQGWWGPSYLFISKKAKYWELGGRFFISIKCIGAGGSYYQVVWPNMGLQRIVWKIRRISRCGAAGGNGGCPAHCSGTS